MYCKSWLFIYEGIGSIPVGGSVRHDACIFPYRLVEDKLPIEIQTKPEDLAISCQLPKCTQDGKN